jgi:hypothetical protein
VPDWERVARRLLHKGDIEVLVTVWSAALLSREIAAALRGRAWEVPLYHFSFGAALRHRAEAVPADPGSLTGAALARTERAFLGWLDAGGFPEAQGLDAGARGQLLLRVSLDEQAHRAARRHFHEWSAKSPDAGDDRVVSEPFLQAARLVAGSELRLLHLSLQLIPPVIC